MKKILIPLILAGMLISCNSKSVKTSNEKAPVDNLIASFCNGWNNHDSIAVRNLFLDDALLIDDNILAANGKELSMKWIKPNMPYIKSITPSKLQEWSSGDRAGYTGTYKMVYLNKNSVLAYSNGLFTVNWLKTNNGDWKITTTHIHSLD